jgi:hypothetical protein
VESAYGLYGAAHVYTVSHTKKRTSELFSATLTPQRENQAEQCSYTIWGGQLGSSDLSCLQSILVLRIVGYWAIPVSIGSLLALAILSALTLRFHTCKPCYPGSGWGRQLWPARYPGLGDCWVLVEAGESLYIEAVLRYCAFTCAWRLKSCSLPWAGANSGSVDWWLCQKFHQIFGDSRAAYPRFVCVRGRGLSPLETYMLWACYWRQRRSGFAADHVLGNSVGANE